MYTRIKRVSFEQKTKVSKDWPCQKWLSFKGLETSDTIDKKESNFPHLFTIGVEKNVVQLLLK